MGSGEEEKLRNCHDCGAKPGEQHVNGCDTERCRLCGGQAISCGCFRRDFEEADYMEEARELADRLFDERVAKIGGRLEWTGRWPGEAECEEFGWYSHHVPGVGWVRCDRDHPGAGPDINRLYKGECRWNQKKGRFVLKGK